MYLEIYIYVTFLIGIEHFNKEGAFITLFQYFICEYTDLKTNTIHAIIVTREVRWILLLQEIARISLYWF